MSETASISSGIAARYATAIFELAKDAKKLPALESDMTALSATLSESADLRGLITSPIVTREEQSGAITGIAKKMGLSDLVTNMLGLMAGKRRLFVLPALIKAVAALIAEEKGEVAADVVSAKKLTKAQETKLAAALKKAIGKDVNVNATVDEALIGGLVVKVGSTMIDSSIAAKLNNLQNAMKEVG